MRHNDLYHTTPNPPYHSASRHRQCPKFVMKPPTYDPTQNFLRVPSLITALCLLPSLTTPIGDDQYPPEWGKDRASHLKGQPYFTDGSGPIFSMYLEMAEEEDKKMTERWKADAEGILVFVRLCLLVPYF